MFGVLGNSIPYDSEKSWYINVFQISTLLFIFGSAAIVFSPFCICFLAYYIGESVVRGIENRWDFFSKGESEEVKGYYWWDGPIHLSVWMIVGALFGLIVGDWGHSFAFSLIMLVLGGLMELVYSSANSLILPPMTTGITAPNVYQNNSTYRTWTPIKDRGETVYRETTYQKPKPSWAWQGYQVESGPKEDTIFSMRN